LAALGAHHGDFNPLPHSRRVGSGDGGQPFVLRLLAGLASLGWILQSFIVKENLFTGSPNEFLATINTQDFLIIEFGRRGSVGREDFGL
jgi:hypothetical protein